MLPNCNECGAPSIFISPENIWEDDVEPASYWCQKHGENRVGTRHYRLSIKWEFRPFYERRKEIFEHILKNGKADRELYIKAILGEYFVCQMNGEETEVLIHKEHAVIE